MTICTPAQLDSRISEALHEYPGVSARRIAKAIVEEIDSASDLLVVITKRGVNQAPKIGRLERGHDQLGGLGENTT